MASSPTQKNVWQSFLFSRWSLLGLMLLLVLVAVVAPYYLVQRTLTTTLADTSYASSLKPGSQAKLVVEVSAIQDDNSLKAWALDRNSDGTYTRTQRTLTITWNSEQVSLGNSQDVYVGAMIQVHGQVDDKGILRSDQLVILTNKITVH